jgi:tRNA dimethylallyltransferase
MIPLGAIIGPTATGKSTTAIEVAGILNGEIISVDSMQVYRGMDIGTAKVGPDERYTADGKYIPHHMLDIVDPDVDYSVGRFQKEAALAVKDIHTRGKLPILVGGTGLYFNALVYEYEFSPGAQDTALRSILWKEAETHGPDFLHEKLQVVDPQAAKSIHPHDTKRVIRALEVYKQTGKRISESTRNRKKTYKLAAAGLYMDRNELYERVNLRVDQMIDQGLVEEVKELLDQGIEPSTVSMQALGYKEVAGYLLGQYDLETCIHLLKKNTRKFAKRQLTWFRRDKNIKWFSVSQFESKTKLVEGIASYFRDSLQI